MKNSTYTWITIKYEDRLFDVRLSRHQIIDEIRTIDSEINIAPILNEKIIRSMQLIATQTKLQMKEAHHAI